MRLRMFVATAAAAVLASAGLAAAAAGPALADEVGDCLSGGPGMTVWGSGVIVGTPGEAVEMRLPLMSESLLMPVPSMVTKCTRLG